MLLLFRDIPQNKYNFTLRSLENTTHFLQLMLIFLLLDSTVEML